MERQGYFKCNVENGRIEGYNARIENDNFEKNLEDTAELIYREAPEWVLEVGEETFLADLCQEFTTVVTQGCVKTIPVTNAPISVLASDYTMEEEQRYQNWLKPYQQFVEVKHSIVGNAVVVEKEKKENYGIAENHDHRRLVLKSAKTGRWYRSHVCNLTGNPGDNTGQL